LRAVGTNGRCGHATLAEGGRFVAVADVGEELDGAGGVVPAQADFGHKLFVCAVVGVGREVSAEQALVVATVARVARAEHGGDAVAEGVRILAIEFNVGGRLVVVGGERARLATDVDELGGVGAPVGEEEAEGEVIFAAENVAFVH
jgi:hypothetical protein